MVKTTTAGLEHPWSLAFLPDGRLLVTERPVHKRGTKEGQATIALSRTEAVETIANESGHAATSMYST